MRHIAPGTGRPDGPTDQDDLEPNIKALCWRGKHDIRCDSVPDPSIEHPRDAGCAICGSDLHLFDGCVPGMEDGGIIGHEFMGEVVEVGARKTSG